MVDAALAIATMMQLMSVVDAAGFNCDRIRLDYLIRPSLRQSNRHFQGDPCTSWVVFPVVHDGCPGMESVLAVAGVPS